MTRATGRPTGRPRTPLAVRFEAKVDRSGGPDACHPWTGRVEANGYGMVGVGGAERRGVHVVALELATGERVPKGWTVDHRCHNDALAAGACSRGLCPHRRCCNPRHLVALPSGVNTRASTSTITHCPAGHPYDAENTYVWRGKRQCRTCGRDTSREFQRSRRSSAVAARSLARPSRKAYT